MSWVLTVALESSNTHDAERCNRTSAAVYSAPPEMFEDGKPDHPPEPHQEQSFATATQMAFSSHSADQQLFGEDPRGDDDNYDWGTPPVHLNAPAGARLP